MPADERPTSDVDQILAELFATGGRDLSIGRRKLHQLGEVHRSRFAGWVITGYRACDQTLRDAHAIRAADRDASGRGGHTSVQLINGTFMMMDPPDHTRIRRLVGKAFTPRAVAHLQPAIEKLLTGMLDRLAARADGGDQIDLMGDLAFPFPVAVIGQLIGVPTADQPQFQPLIRELTRAVEITADDTDLAAADDAAGRIVDYFDRLIGERQGRPADDLVSALLAVRDSGDRLTADELRSTLILLFLAGFETTTNLIGNGLLALLTHPDELRALRGNPAGMPAAVTELLRFDTPVQLTDRVTARPLTLPDATVIPADRHVLILLGTANHDPRVFTDPEQLRLDRSGPAPISFGSGIHFCLGAGLAQLEARLLFTQLLNRFPTIELAGPPRPRAGLTIRGLTHLPLRLSPATPAAQRTHVV